MDVESVGAQYRGKNVLVTGGLGFIGSNLARALVGLGANVTVVDALFPEYGGNLFNLDGTADRVQVNISDIGSETAISALVREQDFIFNLAGQISHTESMANPFRDMYVNAQCHLTLLEACRRNNQAAKIVYASTRSVYGSPSRLPVDETVTPEPIDVNGVNKLSGEQFHLVFHKAYGLRTCALRLTNTYGPRMRPGNIAFINLFLKLALDDETISIFGDGEMLRDLLYVDDAVSAFLAVGVCEETNGEVYNVGSASPVTVGAVARLVTTLAGRGQCELKPYPPEHKRVEIGHYYAGISKLQRAVGWSPRVTLEDGLTRTIEFLEEHRDRYWGVGE
jgi:nucleoside-diphosphate-sugar epimerase